jgi:glycosyltransferase involved in cell wall biosynthesis
MRSYSGLPKAFLVYNALKRNRTKLRHVDLFIAVSDYVKQFHRKHLGLEEHRIATIPNFCNPHEADRNEMIEEIPDDYILFAGALIPIKGVDVLIEAYEKLNTDARLLILGIEHPDYHYRATKNIVIIRNAPNKVVIEAMSRCRFSIGCRWPERNGRGRENRNTSPRR